MQQNLVCYLQWLIIWMSLCSVIYPDSILLPAATKLWPRLCFYTCVWFCSRGGLRAGRTPPGQGDPHPPLGMETPPAGRNPPGSRHPPTRAGRNPPQEQTPPWQGGTPPPGADIPLVGRPPQGKQTAAYGQWAAGTHPTGMHSCLIRVATHQGKIFSLCQGIFFHWKIK